MIETWRNRIVEHGVKPAKEFLAHPLNYRIHPKAQQDAMAGVLTKLGWIDEVIENCTTGHVLNGHLRIALALREGEDTPVPYKSVNLSPEEETLVLATFDPLAAMAEADAIALDTLLQQVHSTSRDIDLLLLTVSQQSDRSCLGHDETETHSINDRLFSQVARIVLAVSDITVIEAALFMTGVQNRGQVMCIICQAYMDGARSHATPD